MIAFAALTGALPKLGVLALAGLVSVALLSSNRGWRAGGVIGALVLAPVLLLADIWHSPQLAVVHHHPAEAAVGVIIAAVAVTGCALLLAGRPWLIAPLVLIALPFRIPIQTGGTTSNLLVPLYFIVGAGSLAFVFTELGARGASEDMRGPVTREPPRGLTGAWVQRLLALYIVLYAVQASYSPDFEKALQQMVFFYVPFALMFCLLRDLDWDRRLLRGCLQLLAVLAVVFALVGFVEYATKTIILNPKLVVQNDLHAYFTVNSVFFDPDIFGRFLALVMVLLAAALLYARRRGEQLAVTAVLAVLWAALLLTLSRSSLSALLVGLATLAALRWRPSRTLLVVAAVVALGVVAVLVSPKTFGLNQGLNGASSGRAGLVRGGVQMFSQRPVWGYGSGSFVVQYRREHPATASPLAASHTIAVTIAAEQGLIGELTYVALVLVALATLLHGARGDPARAAIGATFLALILHTNLYADFLEDPLTWALLAVGAALARAAAARPREARRETPSAPAPVAL